MDTNSTEYDDYYRRYQDNKYRSAYQALVLRSLLQQQQQQPTTNHSHTTTTTSSTSSDNYYPNRNYQPEQHRPTVRRYRGVNNTNYTNAKRPSQQQQQQQQQQRRRPPRPKSKWEIENEKNNNEEFTRIELIVGYSVVITILVWCLVYCPGTQIQLHCPVDIRSTNYYASFCWNGWNGIVIIRIVVGYVVTIGSYAYIQGSDPGTYKNNTNDEPTKTTTTTTLNNIINNNQQTEDKLQSQPAMDYNNNNQQQQHYPETAIGNDTLQSSTTTTTIIRTTLPENNNSTTNHHYTTISTNRNLTPSTNRIYYYCKKCQRYRKLFDHHCDVLQTCIAERNRGKFYIFLWIQFIYILECLYYLPSWNCNRFDFIYTNKLTSLVENTSSSSIELSSSISKIKYYGFIIVVYVTFYVITFILMFLLSIQTYCAFFNTTTYEQYLTFRSRRRCRPKTNTTNTACSELIRNATIIQVPAAVVKLFRWKNVIILWYNLKEYFQI